MNKKKIIKSIKLQIKAGSAGPAYPVGPILGQAGVNIMDFCKKFNEATKDQGDLIIPVIVTIYADRTFDFVLKSPPVSVLIKKMININSGSKKAGIEFVGSITEDKLLEIAKIKINDLNTKNLDSAVKIIAGTAKSLGVKIIK